MSFTYKQGRIGPGLQFRPSNPLILLVLVIPRSVNMFFLTLPVVLVGIPSTGKSRRSYLVTFEILVKFYHIYMLEHIYTSKTEVTAFKRTSVQFLKGNVTNCLSS